MSILGKIENGIKTLAHESEDALKLFVKDEPKIEAVTSTTLLAVSPFVAAVALAVAGAPEAAAVAAILAAVSSKLAAAQVVITSLNSAASAKGLLQSVVADLAQILAVVGVKSPTLTLTITNDVNKISAALQIIIAAI
jgi:hypothetical protein